jgi:hypothetical protein
MVCPACSFGPLPVMISVTLSSVTLPSPALTTGGSCSLGSSGVCAGAWLGAGAGSVGSAAAAGAEAATGDAGLSSPSETWMPT